MSHDQNPYVELADMWMKAHPHHATPTTADRHYLSLSDQHELFNEPISSDYVHYPNWLIAFVWIPVMFGCIALTGLAGYGLYLLLH